MSVTSLLAVVGAPQAPTPPTFPIDFYTGEQDIISLNQGGYTADKGFQCCSMSDSPQCKVQTEAMGSDVRQQGSMNRTRGDSAQGAIITWFNPVQKQMAVVPGDQVNSTHKWACVQYCPQLGDFISEVLVGDGQKGFLDKPKYKGQKTVTQAGAPGAQTKTCDEWEWTETIFGVIPMEKTQFYIDSSVSPAQPFYKTAVIEPFGGAPIGSENASYLQFTPQQKADLDDYFDIDPDSITGCEESPNCDQQSNSRAFAHFRLGDSYLKLAKQHAKHIRSPVRGDPPPQPNITFGSDFVADEHSVMLVNQGGQVAASGDICCDPTTPQCQVQAAVQSGTRYLDVTNQRTRFEDTVANQVVIDDYSAHKSMLINVTAGVETCQEFCPIDPQDTLEPLDPFDPFDPIKDLGATTIGGKAVEHYQWADKILKVITMQTTDFYADITDPQNAVPVFLTTALEPLGQQIGTQNQSWSNFAPGTPDPAKFKIAGMDTCPRSNNCGQSKMQLHRAALRQKHTFYNHLVKIA